MQPPFATAFSDALPFAEPSRMPAASHITFIKHELDGFHQSLVGYRQQMGAWYSQPLVKTFIAWTS
ncbi:hypothetical protein F0170_13050 [Pseudomonas sp. MAFF 730085]|uniref:Uncharacterized protein n=1 Tax=Pseudomonas kitaguniensis TaxID=2607908 RepID=A0A5N7JU32_9PSED|nr:hypothetical protein [Pseudomonas kitaguniensis]